MLCYPLAFSLETHDQPSSDRKNSTSDSIDETRYKRATLDIFGQKTPTTDVSKSLTGSGPPDHLEKSEAELHIRRVPFKMYGRTFGNL